MGKKIIAYGNYYKDFFDALDKNGFQKKTQKTPNKEIDKALKLKKEERISLISLAWRQERLNLKFLPFIASLQLWD